MTGACPAVAAPIRSNAYADVCSGNTPERGTTYGTAINANFNSLESKEYLSTSTFGGEHALGGWELSYRLNYTTAQDGRNAPAQSNFATSTTLTSRPTVEYDLSDPDLHRVRLYRTVLTGTGATAIRSRGEPVTAIETFPLALTGAGLRTRKGSDETTVYTGKFDLDRDMTLLGSPFELELGGFAASRTKKSSERITGATAAQIAAAGLPPVFATDFSLGKPFLGDIDLGYTFNYFSQNALEQAVRNLVDRGIAVPLDSTAAYYKVKEEILAGYATGTLEQDWGNIVFGARVERTQNTGRAFVTVPGSGPRLVEVGGEETLVFPSAHLNWNVTEDVKVRFGVTTGASRPDYDDLRPNFSINDAESSISGGNPEAGPEKAVGVDAYLEWYIQPQGFFSIGVYYKDLTDVLFTSIRTFGLDTLDSGWIDRSGYVFRTLDNGGSGYIAGIEAAYSQTAEPLVERFALPTWLGGFGLQANVTLNESEADTPPLTGVPSRKVRLPGTSDLIYNLSITTSDTDSRRDSPTSIAQTGPTGSASTPSSTGNCARPATATCSGPMTRSWTSPSAMP